LKHVRGLEPTNLLGRITLGNVYDIIH
jgi:hypothetical protein